ncbi:putative sugar nucleotidyl transferase [Runella sp. MFBS21]|uniref:putative sugar nucleotidyl transferase n=1 Tax=Runella sp. MFBS21 TaxID=3034018 RepID=UPI0023F66124|nr:putative sugar nucleotidyl transferase [Runella sp. MFBS21]MDF7818845.1 putative sugar nucleotidyl transferase [Runella sp. MFBS21]
MANFIIYDDSSIRPWLLPFTFTRPVSEIRCGIWTLTQKWQHFLKATPSFLTESYLQAKFPLLTTDDNVFLNGAVCATKSIAQAIGRLNEGEALIGNDLIIAYRSPYEVVNPKNELKLISFIESFTVIQRIWDIYGENGAQIKADFEAITHNRTSQPIDDPYTHCYAPHQIFVEEGANIRASILNAQNGPIYIGKNATIHEGSVIMGPFSLGNDATVNWGAKMRMNTSIGPYCKVGGEVSNSVLFGCSNKGHDGFLGNSVLGEWCNLGANCNNSNLKNDYTNVKLYSYATHTLEDSNRLFCGLFMGDFTKAGISTMFNTGTVVGVNVNVFGAGFQPKHIPSFTWGGAAEGFTEYRLEKALKVVEETISRKGEPFTENDQEILKHVFEITRP